MGSKLLRDKFQQLKSSQHEWGVVEKYISGQKGYCCAKTDTLPVVVIDEEKKDAQNRYLYNSKFLFYTINKPEAHIWKPCYDQTHGFHQLLS